MDKVIKAENTPDVDSIIETIKYASFGGQLSTAEQYRIEMERMEKDDRTFAICSMIYGMRFLEADEAKKSGFQSGYAEGQEKAREEIQEIIASHDSLYEALKAALNDIDSLKEEILAQAENDIIKLVVAIAEKLVCRELKEHPDAIVDIVKMAIKGAKSRDEITIRIHPDDYKILEQRMGELKQSLEVTGGGAVNMRIEENGNINPGGCIIETSIKLIDMSLETRMESVFSALDI